MRFLFFLAALFSALSVIAQKVVNVDNNNATNSNIYGSFYTVSGVPFSPVKYVRVASGSAYFSENWMKADLLLENQKQCLGVIIRLDLLENSIEYIDAGGNKMIATTPVREINLLDTISGESFHFIHSSLMPAVTVSATKLSPGWYQLLSEGVVSLYKYVSKTMIETREYGAAAYEQNITGSGDYFVLLPAGIEKVKKINVMPDLLADKKEQLKSYISSNKLFGRSDSDFIAVVSLYNRLK